MTQVVMAADGVDARELEMMLKRMARHLKGHPQRSRTLASLRLRSIASQF